MAARLIIRYRGAGQPLSWLAEDERGRVLAGPCDDVPLPAATLAGAREIVVLVPGEDVLLAETAVAARSREQLARAIPFALEDQLAEPVETLHFAVAADTARTQRVAIVRRDRMSEWLAGLAAAGVRADVMLPDVAALPASPDAPVVLVEEGRALVRLGPANAFVAASGEIAALLGHGDAPRDPDGRPRVHLHLAGADPRMPEGIAPITSNRASHALLVLATGLRAAIAPNLLSGAYAPGHRSMGARRDWRLAAMLAIALAVLGAAYQITDRIVLDRRAKALDGQMRAVYRDTFPGATRITADVRAQMQGELSRMHAGGQGAGPLALIRRVAPVVTNGTRHQLQGIEYRNGNLELLVRAPAVAALDALRESVASLPGIRVELASATTSEQGAEGRLRIREEAP